MLNSVLYFGRKNCPYSNKVKNLLKKKSKKFYYIESNFFGEKIDKKIIKIYGKKKFEDMISQNKKLMEF